MVLYAGVNFLASKNRIHIYTKPPKTIHILCYTEPFSTILQLFESPRSQLSNHCKIVENGSVYRKIWSVLNRRGVMFYELCSIYYELLCKVVPIARTGVDVPANHSCETAARRST